MSIPQAFTELITLADGREITIETGKLAKQADGSVVVKCGGTMLLATVVANKEANPGVDFLPLTVDYREKFMQVVKSLETFSVEKQDLLMMKFLQ
jgi:polyribonucleotide nucleotidyltransferase